MSGMKSVFRNVLPARMRRVSHRLKRVKPQAECSKISTFSESDVILAYFRRFPRAGEMLDVGAHYGGSSLRYLKMGWTVWAFEPDPAKADVLEQHAGDARFNVFPWAVSNENRDNAPLFASAESTGISTLSPFRQSHREVARVPVRTLASIVEQQSIDHIDFLKVDAEGFDLFVLQGFSWESMRPEIVLCEFEDRKTRQLGYDYHDLASFLGAREYRVYLSEWEPIEQYGRNHKWKDIRVYPTNLTDPEGWGNLIAIHRRFDSRPLEEEITRRKAQCAAN